MGGGFDRSECNEPGLWLPFFEVLELRDLTDLRELLERLERAWENPSTIFCTPFSFRAPDNDGKQTATRAKHASRYMKYRPEVETTIEVSQFLNARSALLTVLVRGSRKFS